jgi:hypothetical protein
LLFLRSSRFLSRVLPRQRPARGLAVIRCRAMAGSQDKPGWRPYLPHRSGPDSLARESVRRMDRSIISGPLDTGFDSTQPCCSIPGARSWRCKASTSPSVVDSWAPPHGQEQRAATRAATCLRFRVLSSWGDPESSRLTLPCRPERQPRLGEEECPDHRHWGRKADKSAWGYRWHTSLQVRDVQ